MNTLSTISVYLVVIGLLGSAGQSLAQSPAYDDSMENSNFDFATSGKEVGPYLDSGEIKPGAIIKIHLEENSWNDDRDYGYLEGQFQYFDNGVLYMSVDGATVGTRTEDIYQMKVRTGSSSAAWGGAMLGLAAGGLIAAVAQPDRSDSGLSGLSHIEEDMTQGAVIVFFGIIVGATIGRSLEKGTWENVYLDHQTFGLLGQFTTDYRIACRFWF